MKTDKKRVEGEQWSDARLRAYLASKPLDGTDPDFHCLYRAYTRMTESAFAQFVLIFKNENRNLQAVNLQGQSMRDLLTGHRRSRAYLNALEASRPEQ